MPPSNEHISIERSRPGLLPNFAVYLLLIGILLPARWLVWSHPDPTHPDEAVFVEALGFPAAYPVHAPGYPLWVGLGTVAQSIGLTGYTAFKIWSFAASLLGPCLLLALGTYLFSPRVSLLTALIFGLLPVTWFHSVTASTYVTASCFGIAIAWLIWSSIARQGSLRFWLASIALCVCMFLRTDVLLYLGPLLLFGAYCHRRITTAAALILPPLALAAFYWLAHQIYAGAEPDAFARRSLHARDVVLGTSVFELGLVNGLLRNGVKVLTNLGWNLGWLTVVLGVAALLRRLTHSLYDEGNVCSVDESATLASRRRWFVAVWLMPGLLFLTLMHCVQGYFLWILPPLCLGGTLIAQHFLSQRALATALVIAIVFTVLQFLLYPWSADSEGTKRTIDAKIGYLSIRGLAHIDRRSEIHLPGDTWLLP